MTEQNRPPVEPAEDLPEQMRVRRSKRDRMLAEGVAPYPVTVPRTATLASLREKYADLPTDTASGDRVSVTGRGPFFKKADKDQCRTRCCASQTPDRPRPCGNCNIGVSGPR